MNKILRTQKWFLEWFLIVSTNEIALWLKYGDGIGMHFVHNAIRGWLWSCEEPNELWQSAWSRADIRVEIILFLLNPWLIMLPGVVAQIEQGATEVDKGCYSLVFPTYWGALNLLYNLPSSLSANKFTCYTELTSLACQKGFLSWNTT